MVGPHTQEDRDRLAGYGCLTVIFLAMLAFVALCAVLANA